MAITKTRSEQVVIFPIARADSSTEKCVLPKYAFITDVEVFQNVDATTDVGTVDVGTSADADGFLDAFSMATTAVGHVKPGTAAGDLLNTVLTADTPVLSTYTAGSSTAGGTGWVTMRYFMVGPGETGFSA